MVINFRFLSFAIIIVFVLLQTSPFPIRITVLILIFSGAMDVIINRYDLVYDVTLVY